MREEKGLVWHMHRRGTAPDQVHKVAADEGDSDMGAIDSCPVGAAADKLYSQTCGRGNDRVENRPMTAQDRADVAHGVESWKAGSGATPRQTPVAMAWAAQDTATVINLYGAGDGGTGPGKATGHV